MHSDFFIALAALALPPGILIIPIFFAAWLWYRGRRSLAKVLILACLILAWTGSTAIVADYLMQWHTAKLEPLTPQVIARSKLVDRKTLIVVLGMGEVSNGAEYQSAVLTGEGMARLRYGVYLSKRYGWSLLYSGGAGPANQGLQVGERAEAESRVAQRMAQADFGVSVNWADTDSFLVRESAANTRKFLRDHPFDAVVLVAHAWKMPRAIAEFEAAGIHVTPAPIEFPDREPVSLVQFVPTSEGVRWVRNVVRERMGIWGLKAGSLLPWRPGKTS